MRIIRENEPTRTVLAMKVGKRAPTYIADIARSTVQVDSIMKSQLVTVSTS
jgi:hypothetical protein